jgi:hypothetical protein
LNNPLSKRIYYIGSDKGVHEMAPFGQAPWTDTNGGWDKADDTGSPIASIGSGSASSDKDLRFYYVIKGEVREWVLNKDTWVWGTL